ncbi:transmembrane protein 19-like protein [Dinothrombium tinctorium]|uniref:Transmembrane protein 19 n=1 Tax=Dinothrombium tinctorium TaxID=1965070 RepID=A0A3S3PIU9_9ACAR|nr:transmembrane protein 19-like protein [Dinothrombium tinctorium]
MMIIAALFAFLLPISLSFWILSLLSSNTRSDLPSPVRWLASFAIPTAIDIWGLSRRSLDWSGALAGLIIGFILTLSNYCFSASLFAFFVTSSRATKYKQSLKKKFEAEHKEGGQRNWVQVICNGGVACELAILYMIERGIAGEIPINFIHDYNASWFAIAVLGALSCCNGDTWASELGTVLSKQEPRLITTLQKVPKGTNGGVTVIGLFVSAAGGLVIGAAFYLALLLSVNRDILAISPPQWPIIVIGLFCGLLGSVIDSLLGATLQYSGLDTETGKIVENKGEKVRYISGIRLLDNHSVNLLSGLITAIIAPYFSFLF